MADASGNSKSINLRVPPEPIRVMIEAMSDELKSTLSDKSKHSYEVFLFFKFYN